MKEIKILHLFPKLLSLYGEYGNMTVLKNTLAQKGFDLTLDSYENGPLMLEGYDLVYVGAGTEDNLMEAIRRLLPYAAEIKASVAGATRWLVTGNAMTLFGASVSRYEATSQSLGCFDYTTTIHDDRRYLGDVLTEAAFGGPLVGFINTSSVFTGIATPLLTLKLNTSLGNDKKGNTDGMQAGNFYGTQLIGPVLAKNPHFLCHICRELTGTDFVIGEDTNIQKAYQVALTELSARV